MDVLSPEKIQSILEAALQAADEPLTLDRLYKLFEPGELPDEGAKALLRKILDEFGEQCEGRGIELSKVASGYRLQVRQEYSKWVSRLWEEKPPRYTRALLETLSLIAYKQPVTRGDIEEVRGVTVSTNIMRTLVERGWIREVGQREVPGRPSMYGTTKEFLDYFNLKSLDQLPTLAEVRQLVEPVVVEEAPAGDASAQDSDASDDPTVDQGDETQGDAAQAKDAAPDEPETNSADAQGAPAAAAGDEHAPETATQSSHDDALGEPEITITEPQSSAEVVPLPGVAND